MIKLICNENHQQHKPFIANWVKEGKIMPFDWSAQKEFEDMSAQMNRTDLILKKT